jgi:hypothetical protein
MVQVRDALFKSGCLHDKKQPYPDGDDSDGPRHMDALQMIVTAAQATKSNAEMPKKAFWEARSKTTGRDIPCPVVASLQRRVRSVILVFIVPAPPVIHFVAPFGGTV